MTTGDAMAREIFYWVFNMSITAGLTGSIVLLLRLLPRLPKRFTVLLWSIPFFRMTVPLGLDSPYSLMSLLSRFATRTVVVYQPTPEVSFSMTNCITAADSYFPITYKVDLLAEVFQAASVVWLVGFGVIAVTLGVLYFTTLQEIKDARHLQDNLYLSDKITTPGVYGIVRPKILLPSAYENRDITFILLHEHAHIHRGDNFRRLLGFMIATVHWFNPLAWVFLGRFLEDLELSCDEWVLAKSPNLCPKDYARSLLECRQSAGLFASSFGGAKIKTRIENILSFRKLTWVSLTAFLVLLSAMFWVLLTNAG